MLSIFLIGIALSMDAFSVAITIGINPIKQNKLIIIPIIVSIMHFIMPLIGYYLGKEIQQIITINPKLIMIIILYYLAFIMYKDKTKEKQIKIDKIFSIILFSLSVSIDSFTVGLSLNALTNKIIIPPIIFSICSGTITYIGLILGKYSQKIWQEKSTNIAVILLLLISTVNMCQILVQLFD